MSGYECPRLAEIVIKLARDWVKRRTNYDRYCADSRVNMIATRHSWPTRDKISTKLAIDVANHPFNRFCRWLSKKNCGTVNDLRNAALREFNGYARIVSKLQALDEQGTTSALFARLRKEWPDVAHRLFKATSEHIESPIATKFEQPDLSPQDSASERDRQDADIPPKSESAGLLSGIALARELGVHKSREKSFIRQLLRKRRTLGDESWEEVSNPRRNKPRYLYYSDSRAVRALAAQYKNPKPS